MDERFTTVPTGTRQRLIQALRHAATAADEALEVLEGDHAGDWRSRLSGLIASIYQDAETAQRHLTDYNRETQQSDLDEREQALTLSAGF